MFCLYFLSTHRSDNPENPTSIGRHRKVHLKAFSFIRHLLLIKWETCEIDVQELFWASIFGVVIFCDGVSLKFKVESCVNVYWA